MKEFNKFFRNDGLYWNPKRTLSYNSLYNFIIGVRSAGKTFGALTLGIERFLEGKGKFIYLRRYDTELDGLTHGKVCTIFDEIQPNLPQYNLECEADLFYCDKRHMGWAVPLSKTAGKKSISYADVGLIIMDEFILEKSAYHYLPKEVNLFNGFYRTVVRNLDRFVPVLFLANAVTVTNPYFDFYALDRPKDTPVRRFGPDKLLLVEDVRPKKNIAKVKESAWYKLNRDTDYADYAVENSWLLDNEDFIAKKNRRCVYNMTLRYNGNYIGIWIDPVDWIYYVSNDVDMQFPRLYSVTTDDHKPNVLLLHGARKLPFMRELETAYEAGAVRYESLKLKNAFREIIRMSRNK